MTALRADTPVRPTPGTIDAWQSRAIVAALAVAAAALVVAVLAWRRPQPAALPASDRVTVVRIDTPPTPACPPCVATATCPSCPAPAPMEHHRR